MARRRRIAVAEEAEEAVYRTAGFVVLAAVMGMGPLDLTVIPGRGVAGDRWAEAASRPGDPISASSGGAAFTTANRDALRDELARIDARLTRTPALPPYLQHTLASRRDAIAAFLAESQRAPQ